MNPSNYKLSDNSTEAIKSVFLTIEIVKPVTEVVAVVEITVVTDFKVNKEGDTQSEAEELKIAKKIYYSKATVDNLTGLQEYYLNLYQNNKYFLPEFAILVARAREFIAEYADKVLPVSKAHPDSIIALKVAVVKYIQEFVELDNDRFSPVKDRCLSDIFKDFDNALTGAFRDVSSIKTNIQRRESGGRSGR